MVPKEHQVKFIKGYKDKDILAHEGGTGKTVCACLWLHDNRDSDALVICPKRVLTKWKIALKDWQTKATVVSKEQFKKLEIKKWSAIVVDEADEFGSALFTNKRSKLSEALYNQVKKYDSPILLLTGTPVRSTPWNLHSLLVFRGVYIDWKKWREEFFSLQFLPYLPRPAWMPKSNWRDLIRPYIEKYCDIILLKDCADLPSSTEEVITIEEKKFKSVEFEPSKQFHERHRFEQEGKIEEIKDISKKFRKVLVVAYYIEQLEDLYKKLSKERTTFMVHGSVKNQEEKLLEANKIDDCILIVQAGLGVGFDADTFSCVIFVSLSYPVRDYVQMKWRVRRINNLNPIKYYHIHSGKADRMVYDNIIKGKNFVPSEWIE